MLEIRKSSWHYRLWRFGREYNTSPKNLCQYFWHIALVKVLAPLAAACLILVGIGALVYVIWGHPAETAVVLLNVIAGGFGIIFLGYLLDRAGKRAATRRAEERSNPKPPKEPTALRVYLKARKQKVCPLIRVVD